MKKPHHTAEPGWMKKEGDRYVIAPKGLNIVWGDDTRYWNLSTSDGSATLIQVSWLDVSGMVAVEAGKKYRVNFEVELKPDAFGWNGSPVLVMAKLGKRGSYEFREVPLNSNSSIIPVPDDPSSKPLVINVPSNSTEPNIYFGLYEVWSGKWKGGLVIKNAKVEADK